MPSALAETLPDKENGDQMVAVFYGAFTQCLLHANRAKGIGPLGVVEASQRVQATVEL